MIAYAGKTLTHVLVSDTHQRFGLVDVKPVDNENPLALRVGIDGIFNMSRKIGFVSGWTDILHAARNCVFSKVWKRGVSKVSNSDL